MLIVAEGNPRPEALSDNPACTIMERNNKHKNNIYLITTLIIIKNL